MMNAHTPPVSENSNSKYYQFVRSLSRYFDSALQIPGNQDRDTWTHHGIIIICEQSFVPQRSSFSFSLSDSPLYPYIDSMSKSNRSSENGIRTFIAVDIPQEIRMDIDRLISGFRGDGPGIRWVKAANLHLTLRFLGNIDPASVTGLVKALEDKVNDLGSFELQLSGLGGFPNLRRPRVIWIGTGNENRKLTDLAAKVESACIESGFGKGDKPFSTHLTIGRVKFPKELERLLEKIERTSFEAAPFSVKEIAVVKSDLSPAGPKYTRLETIAI